jgi:GT2 family glycosyltransferase
VRLTPKVAILILNYNGIKWLPHCLSSVANTRYTNYEVYLIDNASSDGSVEFVHRNFPSVRIIQNSSNLGFPEAYNRAIAQVAAEYVVMLNNDTEVLDPRWLEYLVRVAIDDPKVAAVAPKIVSMWDHRVLESVGGMGIPFWRGFVDIGSGQFDNDQYPENFEPFAYCGGAVLVRKSALMDAGGLDGGMFIYLEDSDLSWRFRLRGWRIGYAADSKVAHASGGSTGGKVLNPARLYYCHRNLLRAAVKNCGPSLAWALRSYLLFSLLMILGFLVYEPRKAVVVAKAVAWNIRNLRTTYASRLWIQGRRIVPDRDILLRMYPGLPRRELLEHPILRHTLNVLFDYGDRNLFQTAVQPLGPWNPA